MGTTIAVRTSERLRRRLEERAAAAGQSPSELVREILEKAVDERPCGARIAHLAGSLDLPRRQVDPWRRRIRDRNWRP